VASKWPPFYQYLVFMWNTGVWHSTPYAICAWIFQHQRWRWAVSVCWQENSTWIVDINNLRRQLKDARENQTVREPSRSNRTPPDCSAELLGHQHQLQEQA